MRSILFLFLACVMFGLLGNQGIPITPAAAQSISNSSGTINIGPIKWRGKGYKYANAMITYHNNTRTTFSTVQIHCIAMDTNGDPISDAQIHYSVILGHPSLSPGTKKIKEVGFKNGSQVASISCEVAKAKI